MLSSSSAIAIDFIWQLFKLQIKKNTPHAIIIFCHCHRLHLAIVQATNSIQWIKHVYTTLTTLALKS